MGARLAVIGNINTDFVTTADRMPREGETLAGKELRIVAGGKAANQAVCAARLGATVTLIGCVGKDAFGRALLENFEREGINVEFVRSEADVSTGAAFVTLLPNGANSIISIPGANDRVVPDDVEKASAVIERADQLLVQFSVPLEVVDRSIQVAVDRGVPVQLDPTPVGRGISKLWYRAYRVIPNETEAEMLTKITVCDIPSAIEAARKMRRRGVKNPILKLGARGCLVLDDKGIRIINGYKVDVIDTTGAGDAFAAGLSVKTAEGAPLDIALAFANACGAIACTIFGAQPSLPRRETVEKFLRVQGGEEPSIEWLE